MLSPPGFLSLALPFEPVRYRIGFFQVTFYRPHPGNEECLGKKHSWTSATEDHDSKHPVRGSRRIFACVDFKSRHAVQPNGVIPTGDSTMSTMPELTKRPPRGAAQRKRTGSRTLIACISCKDRKLKVTRISISSQHRIDIIVVR